MLYYKVQFHHAYKVYQFASKVELTPGKYYYVTNSDGKRYWCRIKVLEQIESPTVPALSTIISADEAEAWVD